MIRYKITKGQASALKKRKFDYGTSFFPIQDINGDWFISEQEKDYCNLYFGFEPVEAEFVAKEVEEVP